MIGKLQILTFVGMLGSFGKAQGDVPTCRTTPRRAASRETTSSRPTARRPIHLDEPFGIFAEQTVQKKSRYRWFEVNNDPQRSLQVASHARTRQRATVFNFCLSSDRLKIFFSFLAHNAQRRSLFF